MRVPRYRAELSYFAFTTTDISSDESVLTMSAAPAVANVNSKNSCGCNGCADVSAVIVRLSGCDELFIKRMVSPFLMVMVRGSNPLSVYETRA